MIFFKKKIFILLPVLLLIILAGAAVSSRRPKDNDFKFSLVHAGRERIYKVHLPQGYDENKKTPVVIYFHGGGGGINASEKDGMYEKADKFGFILLSPAGTGEYFSGRWLTWNSGEWLTVEGKAEKGFGYAAINNIDDIGFISKMIEEVKVKYNVDESRIYAAGISNGGVMTYRVACELSGVVAAVAVVGPPATPLKCAPSRPVPIMHIHGTADPCAPYDGGEGAGCLQSKIYQMQSARYAVDQWRSRNKCSNQTIVSYEKGSVKCVTNNECAQNAEVQFCTVYGGGHTWPSGYQYLSPEKVGPVSFDISFDQIWSFFQKFSLTGQ